MARLRSVFRTENALTLPISGTGSAGMEACFVNLLEPGDTAIVGVNGVFGERMCEVARRVRRGGRTGRRGVGTHRSTRSVSSTRRRSIRRPDSLAVVHAETSTGVENDVAPLAALQDTDTLPARRHGHVARRHPGRRRRLGDRRLLLRHPEVPRGAARARRPSPSRRGPSSGCARGPSPRSRGISTSALLANYVAGAKRVYHHTAPVSMVFSLHGALGALLDEGLDAGLGPSPRHRCAPPRGAAGARVRAARRGGSPSPSAHHRVATRRRRRREAARATPRRLRDRGRRRPR